jgi:hypothetical protein
MSKNVEAPVDVCVGAYSFFVVSSEAFICFETNMAPMMAPTKRLSVYKMYSGHT